MIVDPRDPAFIEPDWIHCKTCDGDGTIREDQFDYTCPDCDGGGGWEP